MLRRPNRHLAALIASCAIVASVAGCLKDAKVAGHDQEAHTDQGGAIQAGGDVWSFNFSRTEQSLGGGLSLAVLGWLATFVRSWRTGRDRDTLIRAIEHGEQRPHDKPVKQYLKTTVRNPRIDKRVARMFPKGKP